jgi:hypothetical protein
MQKSRANISLYEISKIILFKDLLLKYQHHKNDKIAPLINKGKIVVSSKSQLSIFNTTIIGRKSSSMTGLPF